jgi:hypothetical protein
MNCYRWTRGGSREELIEMMKALKPGDSIEFVHEEVPPELQCGGPPPPKEQGSFGFEQRVWLEAYMKTWETQKHYGHLRKRRGWKRLLCKIGQHRPVFPVVGDIGVMTCCRRVKMGRS